MCMRTNCYFAASHQNSDIAIRLSDPDVVPEREQSLAIRRRFHVVTLTYDICRVGAARVWPGFVLL